MKHTRLKEAIYIYHWKSSQKAAVDTSGHIPAENVFFVFTLTLSAATRLSPPSSRQDTGSWNQAPGIAGKKRTLSNVVYPKHEHGEAL